MKKITRVLLLVLFAVCTLTSIYAQQSQELTKEQLLQMIAEEKQLIREAAKTFLIDTLPGLMQSDPAAADAALARNSGMFNTMDQEDFMYLLGHFYARMGENPRAISSFESLLSGRLSEDARKMLNMVLYTQMIDYLQKGNRKAAKDYLRSIIFENFNIDRYYPTYLYIWSDLSAEDGEFEDARASLDSYMKNREVIMNRLLPAKQSILNRVQTINVRPFIANPTPQEYDRVVAEIDGLKADLAAVHTELQNTKGVVYLSAIIRANNEEMRMLDGLKSSVSDYMNNEKKADAIVAEYYSKLQAVKQFSISYKKQIDIMDVILQRQYERFLANDPALQDKEYSDMELKRLYDIEKTLEIYNQIIAELDTNIADPALAGHIDELKNQRAEYSDKRSDMMIRKNALLETRRHSSDVQEQIFDAILYEYYSLNTDKKELDTQLAELEDFFATDARRLFNEQMRADLAARVETQFASTSFPNDHDQPIVASAREMQSSVEFIKLQLAYRTLQAKEAARLSQASQLSLEQLTEQQRAILAEKRELVSQIETFISSNPDFQAIEQPNSQYLIKKADLYYILAELQYAVNMDNPAIALNSYRQVVQHDPNFIYKDAALYNIGFISSQLKRNQIDINKDRFYELNSTALTLDPSSKYKYSDFAEAITSYQEIVDNYKSSPYYDESLYRLGVLNYYLATDADEPARFYALATNYFDEIIANPESKYRYDAIYQRGWLRLNTANDEDLKLAMADFLYLLTAIENNQITDPMLIQDYHDDAVKNIAYCLIALDGLDFSSQAKGVSELEQVFAGYSNKQIIARVLDQAAKNKFDLDASLQGADFIWLKINMNPLALENPSLLDSILYIYAREARNLREGQDFNQARQDIYLNLIANYGKDSDWYNANKEKNVAPQLEVVKKAFVERGKRLYIEFSEAPSEERLAAYQRHQDIFGNFTELHGDKFAEWQRDNDKSVLTLYTVLAERSNTPLNYSKAITQLHEYNAKYPDDEDFFLHEGLSYTYSNNMFNLLKNSFAEEGFVPQEGLPASEDQLFTMLSDNSVRFIDVMKQEKYRTETRDKESVSILLQLADIQYDRLKYPEASALYLKALENESIIDARSKFNVYGKLATMSQSLSHFADSEKYFRKAYEFAQSPAERESLTQSILAQIQLAYQAADKANNHSFAASERLRLASELPAAEQDLIQGLRWSAHESYVKAKEYQTAIDLLLQIAGDKKDIEEVYTHYYTAWNIAEADTLMKQPEQARAIKQAFITKYPSSVQAYALKVSDVKQQESLGSYDEAAETYLTLHQQARDKAIDTGGDTPDALMISAIVNFKSAKNNTRLLEVMNQFITLYPNHSEVIPFMEYIANDYVTKGDTLRAEQMAKTIYQKDKSKFALYKQFADVKLFNLATAFDLAYKNKDYTEAFRQRDEFKKVEAAYKKEGLTFNLSNEYEYFASVQNEYDEIQKMNAFMRNYDSQLAAIEKSAVFTGSPANLIKVNVNTKWQVNLIGGDKRIPGYKSSLNKEITKITKLLEQANNSGYDLDNARRLRALDLMARMYQRGADVIQTQIGVFIKTSTENAANRQQYQGEALNSLINQVAYQQNMDLIDAEYGVRTSIFNLYHVAGYRDVYTERSVNRLQEWNLLPDYKIDEYPLNQSWVQKIEGSTTNTNTEIITSPKGVRLGRTPVPASKELLLSRMITTKIAPEFGLLHIVYPYDIDIVLNSSKIEPSVVATDSLEAGKPITTRYAYLLPKAALAEGQNLIELKVPNTSQQPQNLHMNLQLFTDRQKLRDAIPVEVITLNTGTNWRVIALDDAGEIAMSSSAILATGFGIQYSEIDSMEETAAKPIWVLEEAPVEQVVFEIDFNIDTEFREGAINFVAPGSADVYLNGTEITSNMPLDYDAEPFMVYPAQIGIDKSNVVMGKNTLRFVVNNQTQYRGFLASVQVVKSGKEDIR